MTVWVDAQLSPGIARWLSSRFALEAIPVRDLGLLESTDRRIFEAARTAGIVVMTKDRDFVEMVERDGPPPQVVWITSGNTSDQRLREILGRVFRKPSSCWRRESLSWRSVDPRRSACGGAATRTRPSGG